MALKIIKQWEESRHTIDFITDQEIRREELPSGERARLTDWVFTWGRGRGAARYLLDEKLKRGLKSIPPNLRRRLELALCRLLFEERTPEPIIANRAVEAVKQEFGADLANLSNAVLRSVVDKGPAWPDAAEDAVAHLAHSTSHPPWIVERWLNRWREDRTRALLDWNNLRPDLWLRWNRQSGDLKRAKAVLEKAGVDFDTHADFPYFYRLKSSFHAGASDLLAAGRVSVQDPSASLAVRALNPEPGMSILDLCAAPGGKTTLIADLTGGQAQITAVDASGDRLRRLEASLTLMGLKNVRIIAADGRAFAQCSAASFDAVLVDVPCSGFGVLSRRADLRWRRRPEDLPDLVALQRELIRAGAKCTRPGGTLVYSTCSTEPEENEEIVQDFLSDNDEFHLHSIKTDIPEHFIVRTGEIATYSPRDRIDGVYAARIIRKTG